MKFEVCGFECSRTTKLTTSVSSLVLSRQNKDDSVVCIQDAEQMKELGVKNTPALVVDDVLLFQGCAMSEAGVQALLEKQNMRI